jgi:antitoxin PrlF
LRATRSSTGIIKAYSKVSVKAQTVIPQAVRERLGIKPGDRLRYVIDRQGIWIERAPTGETEDPFATFSEWASAADDEAYADL